MLEALSNKEESCFWGTAWKLLLKTDGHEGLVGWLQAAGLPSRKHLHCKPASKSSFRITYFQEGEDPALKGTRRNVIRLGVQVCKKQPISS